MKEAPDSMRFNDLQVDAKSLAAKGIPLTVAGHITYLDDLNAALGNVGTINKSAETLTFPLEVITPAMSADRFALWTILTANGLILIGRAPDNNDVYIYAATDVNVASRLLDIGPCEVRWGDGMDWLPLTYYREHELAGIPLTNTVADGVVIEFGDLERALREERRARWTAQGSGATMPPTATIENGDPSPHAIAVMFVTSAFGRRAAQMGPQQRDIGPNSRT